MSRARSAIVLNSEAYKVLSEPEAFCIDCVWKLNTAFYHNFRLSNHFILRYEKPLLTIDKIWSSHNFRLIQMNVNEGHNGMGFNMWTMIALCKYRFSLDVILIQAFELLLFFFFHWDRRKDSVCHRTKLRTFIFTVAIWFLSFVLCTISLHNGNLKQFKFY